MGMTDPIADMLTRIRNANRIYHEKVDVPASVLKKEIARVLKTEGFIKDFKPVKNENHNQIRVFLKYGKNRERVITGIKRISKPGLRVYVGHHDVPRVLGGLGIAILSTSKGLMTDKQSREAGVGGEVLAYVW